EEQFALAGPAGAAAAVLAPAGGAAVAQGTEPAAQGFIGQEDAVPLVEDVGQVAEVEPRVGRGGEIDDLVLQPVGHLVGGGAGGVAVDEALRAVGLETAFEALDLAGRQAEGGSGL